MGAPASRHCKTRLFLRPFITTPCRSGLVYVLLRPAAGSTARPVTEPAARGTKGAAAGPAAAEYCTGRPAVCGARSGQRPGLLRTRRRRHGLEGIVSKRRHGHLTPPAGVSGWLEIKCPRPDSRSSSAASPTGRAAPMPSARCSWAATTGAVWRSRAAWARASPRQLAPGNCAQRLVQQERAREPIQPSARGGDGQGGAYYVAPTLVCEVAFTEWTGDDRIRHPSFLGLPRGHEAALRHAAAVLNGSCTA